MLEGGSFLFRDQRRWSWQRRDLGRGGAQDLSDREDGESAKPVARQESTEQPSHPARIRAAPAGEGEPNLRGPRRNHEDHR